MFISKSFGRRLLKCFRSRCRLSQRFRQFKNSDNGKSKLSRNIQITFSIHSLAMLAMAREIKSNVAMLSSVLRGRVRPESCLPRSRVTAATMGERCARTRRVRRALRLRASARRAPRGAPRARASARHVGQRPLAQRWSQLQGLGTPAAEAIEAQLARSGPEGSELERAVGPGPWTAGCHAVCECEARGLPQPWSSRTRRVRRALRSRASAWLAPRGTPRARANARHAGQRPLAQR